MQKSKTYLVTGSCGFIGFSLAKKLLGQGNRVVGIDNLNDYYDINLKKRRNKILEKFGKLYSFHKINLEDTKKVNHVLDSYKIDIIVHLAAQAGVRYSMENPLSYAYSNYIGTMNIFEYAKNKKIQQVIYASSSSVYGNSIPPYSEIDSDTNTPISVYAATKKATEVLAHTYSHLYGITTVGLRFFTVYGEYSRPDMATWKFSKKILLGEEISLYAKGVLKRGFTHIDDIIDGIIQTFKLKKGYHIINLGGNQLIQVNTLIRLLEQNLGKNAIIKNYPMQPGDVSETESVQKVAKEKIKFNPKVNFEKGIGDFCKWFKDNQKWILKLKDAKQ